MGIIVASRGLRDSLAALLTVALRRGGSGPTTSWWLRGAGDAADHEAALMARIAEGDENALRSLYDRYETRLFGLGVRLLGDRGLAEELVQETWIRAWRSARRYDAGKGSVTTFVFTLARRAAADLRRRPSSRHLAPGGLPERSDDDPFSAALLGVTVREAMDTLSPEHREVLGLVYDEDLRQADIAERLDIPLGTVKTRAYHGLRALRTALGERGFDG